MTKTLPKVFFFTFINLCLKKTTNNPLMLDLFCSVFKDGRLLVPLSHSRTGHRQGLIDV